MKTKTGVWIDHRKAVLVTITDKKEEIKEIKSDLAKPSRATGGSRSKNYAGDIIPEDKIDRHFTLSLNRYYDEVISSIKNAGSLHIFGPGEAKQELEKRIKNKSAIKGEITIETTDKMTDRQIAAKVRKEC
ncbi:MAG: hypothetical protein ABIH89_10015 [Elusimicrobiota bacterium]